MLTMTGEEALPLGNSFTSSVFRVEEMDWVQFYADRITAGTVTFQGSQDNSNWATLDATELALTSASDSFKVARLGGIYVRAVGDGSSAANGHIYISGPYVKLFSA
jgi:hypothetical protein